MSHRHFETPLADPTATQRISGYYMLWMIDDAGIRCERAAFAHLPKISRLPKKRATTFDRSDQSGPTRALRSVDGRPLGGYA